LNSVKIISIKATKVRRHVDDYARELLASRPEAEEIIVFGSFENDTYAPGTDIDLFLVLCEANDSPRDRIPRFLPDKSLGVAVDVFPIHPSGNRSAVGIAPFSSRKRKPLAISPITLKARTDL